jgi:hypothetical protein
MRKYKGHMTLDWKPRLEACASIFLHSAVKDDIPIDVRKLGQLGAEPASEEQLRRAEARLGVQLPSSYRSFLAASNGWWGVNLSIFRLLAAEEIGYFPDLSPDWAKSWSAWPECTDEEYFVYEDWQSSNYLRAEYFPNCLQISAEGDSAVVLLNPNVKDSTGEWEVIHLAKWLPGGTRYPSFLEFVAKSMAQVGSEPERNDSPLNTPRLFKPAS